ncbi:MAG TPA: cupin domain-containing protein [Terriglobales bacterium]|nr:cupin domain-containing protein [Terriglobales bacterium]
MERFSKLSITALAVILAAALAFAQSKPAAKSGKPAATTKSTAAAKGPVVWNSDQGKWMDSPDMPGLHQMVVTGDPEKGASVVYLKLDAGAAVPWHWHPGAEVVFGNTGTTEVHMLHNDQSAKITSGSYAKMPGHMVHNAKCISKEPCTFYLQSAVPLATTIVDENGKPVAPKAKTEAKAQAKKKS